jgi:hypothetical protein
VLIEVPAAVVEPDASATTASGTTPLDGVTTTTAMGGGQVAVTATDSVDERPLLLVMVTVTMYEPAVTYVCAAVLPGCGPVEVPSPNWKE